LGDVNSSYYVYETDELQVAKLINAQKNHVVIVNQDLCTGIFYGGKFHTCADIVLASVDRQIIGNPEDAKKFSDILEKYKKFPRIVYINKKRAGYRPNELEALLNHNFELLYSSENYAVLRDLNTKEACISEYSFSCVKDNRNYYVSAPQSYMNWHFPDATMELAAQGMRLSADPGIESHKSEYLRFVLVLTYLLALFFAFTGLIRGSRDPINLD
jgi:hypothetical protein